MIELRPAEASTTSLVLRAGDLLMCWAMGGRIRSGADSVEILGPYTTGVLGTDGRIHSPEGLPSKVAFVAHHPGRAEIDLVVGGPWPAAQTIALTLTVE